MPHPWEEVPLAAYEGHMQLLGIEQMQTLNALMHKRIAAYPADSVAVWGVAGGNGLEHIDPETVQAVYGVDVNVQYLAACRARYPQLSKKLMLLCADLSRPCDTLPHAELVLADLLIEYIGIPAFVERVRECNPKRLCCVIQKNISAAFVSVSPYRQALSGIGALHTDVEEGALTEAMDALPFRLLYREEIPLPNGKLFIRLDFERRG